MNFVAFDLETTGTNPLGDRIVEIGAVRFVDGIPADTFGILVNPGIPIPPEASAVNGISDDMVRNQPPVEDVLGTFSDFCGALPLVAHNAPFDFKFMLQAVKTHKARAPKGVVLDTLSMAREVFPGMFNYKLGTLVRHFGFPGGNFHRAEEDSAYCGMLFQHIFQTLEKRPDPVVIEDLIRMTGKTEMRFPQFATQPDQLGLF
ncbi:MAG: 3'-5' exonuclease [Kiritimatiellales bacterium]|nr:3'-5' exonuclease [Kiritimatiellales bacterium]